MSDTVISVENLSKAYRLGQIGTGRLVDDMKVWWARARGKPSPLLKIGEKDHGNREGGTIWALEDVSFDVRQGEVLGIIGRNGAGKSTILKILSRITAPTDGHVKVKGRIASLLEVGMGFHPDLTGRDNIYLNGSILGMNKQEIARKFDEIVAFAETEQFLDTPVKRYSSGMYVRLAFAVAAHLEPEILLVDEVLAVGDTAFQRKCLGKMGDVAEGGRTVLFVSHNMGAVQQLCGSAILMRSGRLHESGSPERVTASYLSDALESKAGVFDLSAHPARSHKYSPIIQKIVLRSATSSSKSHFFPDESLVVELVLRASTPLVGPRLAVTIEDGYGRRITTLASYFRQARLPDFEGERSFSCRLARLNLGPGRYLVGASVATKREGMIDSVDNAAWFDVGWRNNYGDGEPYYGVYGPVMTDSHWQALD